MTSTTVMKTQEHSEFAEPTTASESTSISGFDIGALASTSGFAGLIIIRPNVNQSSAKAQIPDNSLSVDDLEHRLGDDAEWLSALAEARKEIGEKVYSDQVSIASLRLSKGLSQRELAHRCEMSQPHLATIEAGDKDVRLSTARRLAAGLEVDVCVVVNALLGVNESNGS